MTTRRATASNHKAFDDFMTAKFQIDAMLERLKALSDDHFETHPAEINLGQVAIRRAPKGFVDDRVRFSRGAKQPRGDIRHRLGAGCVRTFADHCGKGANTQWGFFATTPVPQAAHHNGNICTLSAAISMKFVQHDKLQAMRVADHFGIKAVLTE